MTNPIGDGVTLDSQQAVQKSLYGGVANYLAMGLSLVTGLLVSMLLVKNISKELFGAYRVFASILVFGSLLASLGVEKALIRFGSELFGKSQHSQYARLFLASFLVRGLFLLCLATGVVLLSDQIGDVLKLPRVAENWLPLAAVVLLVFSLNSLSASFLAARLAQPQDSAVQITTQLVLLSGTALAIHWGYGFPGVVITWASAHIVAFLVYFGLNSIWAVNNVGSGGGASRPEGHMWSRFSKFAAFSYVGLALSIFRDVAVDNLFISYYLGPSDVAIYSLSASLVVLVSRLNPASLLRSILMAIMVSRVSSSGDQRSVVRWHFTTSKLIIFVTLPMLSVLCLLGDKVIIHVFSEEYVAGFPIIIVLSLFMFVSAFEFAFLPIIYALEKTGIILATGLFGVYNALMNVLLIPTFGIMGAAVATGSTGVLCLALYWWYFTSRVPLGLRFPWRGLRVGIVNVMPGAVLVWTIRDWITDVGRLAAGVAIWMTLYLLMSWLNRIFDDDERNTVNAAVGRKVLFF